MLADALLSSAIQVTMHVNPDLYDFFLSGAAAVIHLWHSFPNENYTMPERKDIGERLWRMTIMELMQIRAQPQQDVIKYMDLERDKLAAAIISPASYKGIKTKLDSARSVIDPLYKKSAELRAIAIQCELNTNELIDEISASMQVANDKSQKTAFSCELNTNELIDDWSSWLAHWWWIFLEQWGRKCLTKWSAKFEASKDYEIMHKSWFDYFEPLWLAGCDIARIQQLSNPVFGDDKGKLRQWMHVNDQFVLNTIDRFKKMQRQVITNVLKKVRQYDKGIT
jgi:hypothetical protein